MAETRKFNPATNAVGEAIRAALGEDSRPVHPADQPEPAVDSPAPPTPITTVRTFTFGTTKKPQ